MIAEGGGERERIAEGVVGGEGGNCIGHRERGRGYKRDFLRVFFFWLSKLQVSRNAGNDRKSFRDSHAHEYAFRRMVPVEFFGNSQNTPSKHVRSELPMGTSGRNDAKQA